MADLDHIVPVDGPDHVPAIDPKARWRVIDEPALNGPVDRAAVVVVQRNQFVVPPGTRQAAGLVANAFLQAAINEKHVAVVIDDGVAGTIELVAEQLLGEREGTPVMRTWNGVRLQSKLLSPAAEAFRYFMIEHGEVYLLAHEAPPLNGVGQSAMDLSQP